MYNFDLIESAGITQGQFAELVGVNRVTVNTWVRGKFSPRSDARGRVAQALKLLNAAIESGALPVSPDHRKETIKFRLARISAKLNAKG